MSSSGLCFGRGLAKRSNFKGGSFEALVMGCEHAFAAAIKGTTSLSISALCAMIRN